MVKKKSNKKSGNDSKKQVTEQLQEIIDKKENTEKIDVEKTTGFYSKSTGELKVLLKENPNNKDIQNELEKRRQHWKDYYYKNKEKYKKWGENWRKNNPEKVNQYRKNYYKKKVKSSE